MYIVDVGQVKSLCQLLTCLKMEAGQSNSYALAQILRLIFCVNGGKMEKGGETRPVKSGMLQCFSFTPQRSQGVTVKTKNMQDH